MAKAKVQKSVTRDDPLLPTTSRGAKDTARCGACARLVFVLLPILGCFLILTTLFLLTYRLGVPITETSVSKCLADYSPKEEILAVVFTGATVMFIVTVMRDIQINVYHRRLKSESKCMKALNITAAVCNILAYVGFVILALFEIEGPEIVTTLHFIGSIMYFALSGLYGLLHGYMTCKQTQYPWFCKILFTLVPLATLGCSIGYTVAKFEAYYELEWFAVALAALNVGLLSILFMVDPVDDELRDFFCCRRFGRK
ncbi:hypothetical protein ACHAWF_008037 [Thalassiosira exigua]